jgi:hypothetical protein
MRGVTKLLLAAALAALLATGFAACGGGDSSDTTATATTEDRGSAQGGQESGEDTGGPQKGPEDSSPGEGSGSSSGEASAAFLRPGGDNSIQNFGEEAGAGDLEAATAALAGFMQARAKSDWAKQCVYLAAAAIAPLEQLASSSSRLKGKGCAEILAALGAGTPASASADTMTDGIASLRVEGDRGFALYHGAKGVDYFVPMVKEEGEWKVGALAPSEFP